MQHGDKGITMSRLILGVYWVWESQGYRRPFLKQTETSTPTPPTKKFFGFFFFFHSYFFTVNHPKTFRSKSYRHLPGALFFLVLSWASYFHFQIGRSDSPVIYIHHCSPSAQFASNIADNEPILGNVKGLNFLILPLASQAPA